jgi:hypothetical protein
MSNVVARLGRDHRGAVSNSTRRTRTPTVGLSGSKGEGARQWTVGY